MKDLIVKLRANKITLSVDNNSLLINFDGDHLPQELIEEIRTHKQELIAFFSKYDTNSDYADIPLTPVSEHYPLSSGQLRLWMLSQFDGASEAYNMPQFLTLQESVSTDHFEQAIDAVIKRHESLRTVFRLDENGDPRQWILPFEQLAFKIDYKDFRQSTNGETLVSDYIREDSFQKFDLENGPLIRAALLQIEDNQYVFYYNMHHIISDGWSMNVVYKELLACYQGLLTNKKPELPELKIQYKDFSNWQLAQKHSPEVQKQRTYWHNSFSGELPVIDLPLARKRPSVQTFNGKGMSTYIDKQTTAALKNYIAQQSGTLFTACVASWKALFCLYTGNTDIIIGTPVAGRSHPSLFDQIGFYVNTLALRSSIEPAFGFDTIYQNEAHLILDAFQHQDYPFDTLIEELNPPKIPGRNAIFDVMLVFDNTEQQLPVQAQQTGETNNIRYDESTIAKFDLTITFAEAADQLSLHVSFNTDIYLPEVIEQMLEHYQLLLKRMLDQPSVGIENLNYLSEAEQAKLITLPENARNIFAENNNVAELFALQVEKTPDNTALVFGTNRISYKELEEQSNQFARYILDRISIEKGDYIALKLERSEWLLIAILGILKTGAAYVPIDLSYPAERIAFIEKDSNCTLVVDNQFVQNFSASESVFLKTPLPTTIEPKDLFCMIYTSGTTGNPKGVKVLHKNVVRLVKPCSFFDFSETSVLLSTGSVSFDATLFEYFGTLLNGSTLVMASQNDLLDIDLLGEVIKKANVNCLWLTTSFFSQVVDNGIHIFEPITQLITGGDIVSPKHVKKLQQHHPSVQVINGYGPTENTTFSTTYAAERRDYETLPIGKAISHTQTYILNDVLQPVPVGVTGMLYVGGTGLTGGYHNNPELTDEKFISSPFSEGNKLYKTGDLAMWLPDGNIEFKGRKDNQVKIRGFRIELNEIENRIKAHNSVEDALVIAGNMSDGSKELIAYYTMESNFTESDLRSYLAEHLPQYMLPGYFIELDKFPLTANGKVDRNALPEPNQANQVTTHAFVAPENEWEARVAEIWNTIFQREKTGVTENFFELGGHSLRAVKMQIVYQKIFHVKVELKDMLVQPTIRQHAALISGLSVTDVDRIPKINESADYPVSNAQKRVWILSQLEEASIAYNIPNLIEINDAINFATLQKAIRYVVDRHEALRTVFKSDERGVRQVIVPIDACQFDVVYYDYTYKANAEELIRLETTKDANTAFDLEQGPLFRVKFFALNNAKNVLYFNVHHIIGDAWSIDVLQRDLFTAYEAFSSDKSLEEFEPLSIQYKDYSVWQLDQKEKAAYQSHRDYWVNKLSGEIPLLDLPGQLNRPLVKTYSGHCLRSVIPTETSTAFRKECQRLGGSTFMGLLASWNILFYRYLGQNECIIGTPVAGRNHPDLENQIGFYVNMLALRTEMQKEMTFESLFRHVNEQTLEAFQHQSYPFDDLTEELQLTRNSSRNPLFDVMFTLQKTSLEERLPVLENTSLDSLIDLGPTATKFDLEITFHEIGEQLVFDINYNTSVYPQEVIERLAAHFQVLFSQVVLHPSVTIDQLNYLTPSEYRKVIEEFNNTAVDYPGESSLVTLFEEQVKHTPDHIALVSDTCKLTYTELNSLSNQFGHFLLENHPLHPEDIIGIKQGKHEWMIVSLLAALKAGCAYMPIDPELPAERVAYFENEASGKVIIDDAMISRFKEVMHRYPDTALTNEVKPYHLAYIMYTSGTSGEPKGVMVEHRNVVRLVKPMTYFPMDKADTLLSTGSLSFDATTIEYFGSLLNGAKLVLADHADLLDTDKMYEVMCVNQVNSMWMTASWFNEVFDAKPELFSGLKQLIVGGDVLSVYHVGKLREKYPNLKIVNGYGPTENTTFSTTYQIDNLANITIPIGSPIPNSKVYILDEQMKPVGIGIPGQLYVGGHGVARGYLNKAQLTSEKFFTNPFDPTDRLYDTGDIGYWTSNGIVVFQGRKDQQIKIRGYRIELTEIEKVALDSNPALSKVAVSCKEINGQKQLILHFVALDALTKQDIRNELLRLLPDYMVPQYYVRMEQLPLTKNGKVNHAALTPVTSDDLIRSEYKAPGNPTEEKLCMIWSSVLGIHEIGVNDNFFELGGNSISMIKILHRINEEFGFSFTIKHLYNAFTISDLAGVIELFSNTKIDINEEITEQENFKI